MHNNRTFFFFDYEGSRRRTGYTSALTVPTLLQRAGDFSQNMNAAGAVIPVFDPASTVVCSATFTRQQLPGNRIPSRRLDQVS